MHKPLKVFLLLLFPIALSAQISYHHYLDSSYVWFDNDNGVIFNGTICAFGGEGERYYRFHIIGTESLDGFEWYQVHQDWVQYIHCTNIGTFETVSPQSGVAFHIREDSSHRIFMRTSTNTRMMYDFGVAGLGDTLWMQDYTANFVVDSIDTVYLDGAPRARYWPACNGTGSLPPQFVVEGIGSSLGFHASLGLCQQIWDAGSRLVCCKKGGNTLILDHDWTCGIPAHNPVVGISDPVLPSPQVQWSNETQTLILATDPQQPMEWKVVDMVGNVVRKGNEGQSRIPLPDLATGIYLFSAMTGTQRCAYRFLVD